MLCYDITIEVIVLSFWSKTYFDNKYINVEDVIFYIWLRILTSMASNNIEIKLQGWLT